MTDLNEHYRAEGWGTITDKALGVEPVNVEGQARQVAGWAFEEIKRLKAALYAADWALMEVNGCFPLPHGGRRQRMLNKACSLVREETGTDYGERVAQALVAMGYGEGEG